MEAISLEDKDYTSKRAAWYKIIEAYQVSGQSQVKYCEQNNLNKDHFAYYLSRYRRDKAQAQPTAAFVPMQVVNAANDKWILSIGKDIELQIPSTIPLQQLSELLINMRDKACC